MTLWQSIKYAFKALLHIQRDNFTAWWLGYICGDYDLVMLYAQKRMKEYKKDNI